MGRKKGYKQINIPLMPEIYKDLEAFCTRESQRLGEFVSKAKIAREALNIQLGLRNVSERVGPIIEDMYRVLVEGLLVERQPLRYRIFFGGTDLELIYPSSLGIAKHHENPDWKPSFRFRLGTDICSAHLEGLKRESGPQEPIICCVRVIDADQGKEIFSSEELKIDVSEGSADEIGRAEWAIAFPKDCFSQDEGKRLQWKLEVRFKRVQPLGDRDIVVKASMEREASFYIVSQRTLNVVKLRALYYEALSLIDVGMYEEAEALCRQAAELDPSNRLVDLILAEIYRRRALALTGAPGEEPLEDPIDKFADIYNYYLERSKRGEDEGDQKPCQEGRTKREGKS